MAYTVITKPTAGTAVSKADFGDPVVDNFAYLYALRDEAVWVPLNGALDLALTDLAYFRIPAKLNGGTLISVAAHCKDASSSGAVTLAVKNGSTSMLTTNITIDQGEFDSSTAATAAVIDAANDDVATGDFIEISVVGAGTGVTYCGVELTFRPGA
jgi:hypothetical protein